MPGFRLVLLNFWILFLQGTVRGDIHDGNGSRLWCLRGWTPNELAAMHGNTGAPSISFVPGIQEAFADGTMDKNELVRKIKDLGWKVSE